MSKDNSRVAALFSKDIEKVNKNISDMDALLAEMSEEFAKEAHTALYDVLPLKYHKGKRLDIFSEKINENEYGVYWSDIYGMFLELGAVQMTKAYPHMRKTYDKNEEKIYKRIQKKIGE